MRTHIMLDLETLSAAPDAAIVSIGAVTFGGNSGTRRQFSAAVDPVSAQAAGGRVDASTVMWWMGQSEAARAHLRTGVGLSISTVLEQFSGFVARFDRPAIWGNGAAFDNVILRGAYERCGLPVPWKFWDDRCYRTLKALVPQCLFTPPAIAHSALHDAIAQADHAEAIFARMPSIEAA